MSAMISARPLAFVVSAATLFTATAARADAIDGDWCALDSAQRMNIQGANIVTPGGNRLQGNYTRHAFDYVVPSGETGSGQMVNIVLRGEYNAYSRQGAADAPVKEWRRCQPGVS
jgi:hypothetical protein